MRQLINLLALAFFGVPTLLMLCAVIALQWLALALVDVAEALNQIALLIRKFAMATAEKS